MILRALFLVLILVSECDCSVSSSVSGVSSTIKGSILADVKSAHHRVGPSSASNSPHDTPNDVHNDEQLTMDNEDRFTLFPVKHPDVWNFYKKAVASFWTAEGEAMRSQPHYVRHTQAQSTH